MAMCPNCGSDVPNNSAFCHQCGTRIGGATPPRQQPQQGEPRRQQAEQPPRQYREEEEMPRQQRRQAFDEDAQSMRRPQRDESAAPRGEEPQRRRMDYDEDEPPRREQRPQRQQREMAPVQHRNDIEIDDDEDVEVDADGNEIDNGKRRGGRNLPIPSMPFGKGNRGDKEQKQPRRNPFAEDEDYEDERPRQQRERRQAPPQKQQVPREQGGQAPRMVSGAWNELCIIAMILGMCGMGNPIAAIAAIIVGSKASKEAEEYGQNGATFAKFGLIMGVIDLAGILVLGLLISGLKRLASGLIF